MKTKRIICSIFCLILLPLLFVSSISADVGNSFSGDGGSSFGGGGSFGGGFGGSGFGSFVFLGGGGFSIFTLLIIFMIIAFVSAARSKNRGTTYVPQNNTRSTRVCNEPVAISQIQTIDPNFSADKFKSFASEVFITLQEAWEAKSWKGVRPFESNTLFNTHDRQIQEYINMKKTDHLNMQNIREVTIAQFKEDGDQEVIVVRLYASLLNYVSDDTTGKIIEGSDREYVHRTYCLEFIRSKGVLTQSDKDQSVTNCPNCGAPTTVTSSGECEYCHSVITNGKYGWVLNKYAAW